MGRTVNRRKLARRLASMPRPALPRIVRQRPPPVPQPWRTMEGLAPYGFLGREGSLIADKTPPCCRFTHVSANVSANVSWAEMDQGHDECGYGVQSACRITHMGLGGHGEQEGRTVVDRLDRLDRFWRGQALQRNTHRNARASFVRQNQHIPHFTPQRSRNAHAMRAGCSAPQVAQKVTAATRKRRQI